MAPPTPRRRYSDSSESSSFTYRGRGQTEEMEHWFSSLGLYRKFIARNESCIFRAVSDFRYLSQSFYHFVHRDLLGYTEKLCPNQFLAFSQQTDISKETYLKTLRDPVYYKPSPIDLCIISRMYGYNFKLFSRPDEAPVVIASCARNQTILIYTDFESTYDLVYTEERYSTLAFCQHIVYELYYKHVFKLEDIDYAVKKMLCQEMSPTRLVPGYSDMMDAEGFCPNVNIDKQVMPLNAVYAKRFEMRAKCGNMRRLLEVGITPFPYKVAKALDPYIYRNIEFDVWVEQKRGPRSGLEIWSNSRLVRGVSCIVRFPNGEGATCHIQDVFTERNQVKVYVVKEKQGRMMTVPMEWLEVLGHNQVLVAYRRYLRGTWAEATEQALARKSSEPEVREVQCGDVSSSGDLEETQYITPVIAPHKPAKSKLARKIVPPSPEPNPQTLPLVEAPPLMMAPPVCYEPVPPQYFPGHIEWQPPYPDMVPSPYNVLVDPGIMSLDYHNNVDYNYNYQEAPPPGYMHMTPVSPEQNTLYSPQHNTPAPYDVYNTPVFSPDLQRNTLTPFPPEVHSGLFSPEMNTASPVFFTEVQAPPMFPHYCGEPMVPVATDFTMPPPYGQLGWHMTEGERYLMPPPPSYAFCSDMYHTLTPPNPEYAYYAPMNQMV